ncbi:MAG: GAF domain-containing protein, partial [candidate division NC10 bacterium]
MAIERAQLHETIERRAQQLTRLSELTKRLIGSLDIEQIGAEVLGAMQALITGSVGRLWDLEEGEATMRLMASAGLRDAHGGTVRFRRGEGMAGIAAATRKPVRSRNLTQDPRFINRAWAVEEGLRSAVILPLLHGDRVHGILAVMRRVEQEFTDEEVTILEGLAGHAAVALANARLHQEAIWRGEQLEAIRAVSVEITRELDLDALLQLITVRVVGLIGGGQRMIRLWDEDGQWLVPRAYTGSDAHWGDRRLRLGEGVAGTAAQRRQGMIVNDFRTAPYATPLLLEGTTHTAVLAEPLLFGDRLVGVIHIDREADQQPFTEKDRQLLALFAQQAAIAIENARLHEATVRRGEQLEALLSSLQTVTSGLDLKEILDRVFDEAIRISGVPHVKVLLLDKTSKALRVGTVKGSSTPPGATLPVGASLSGLVVQSGEPLFIADAQNDPRNLWRERDRELGIVTYLGLPIKKGEEVLGVLTFNNTSPYQYTPEEMILLTSFAAQAAIAIENARMHEE